MIIDERKKNRDRNGRRVWRRKIERTARPRVDVGRVDGEVGSRGLRGDCDGEDGESGDGEGVHCFVLFSLVERRKNVLFSSRRSCGLAATDISSGEKGVSVKVAVQCNGYAY